MKFPDGTFYGGRKHTRRRIFVSLCKLGCGLQEFNSRIFQLHLTFKQVGIVATTFEKTQIHLDSDVSAAVAFVVVKLPMKYIEKKFLKNRPFWNKDGPPKYKRGGFVLTCPHMKKIVVSLYSLALDLRLAITSTGKTWLN